MAWNEKMVEVTVGADDVILLQGILRQGREKYARNVVVTEMLDRIETALQAAQDKTRREATLMGPDYEP
jgi:hypothetical protein